VHWKISVNEEAATWPLPINPAIKRLQTDPTGATYQSRIGCGRASRLNLLGPNFVSDYERCLKK
jgi:hypothetical protein